MERRELIKLVTMATGAALAVPLSSSLLTACSEAKKVEASNYSLTYFSESDFASLQNMLDIIIPKSDSPSAVDVGVDQIIDNMVGVVYSPDQQNEFTEKFTALMSHTVKPSLESFKTLMASDEEKDALAKAGLLDVKQQAVAYYLSTEEIGKNYLNYLPVPGEYEPCISVESVGGKAWTL
ncbi:gluconate 2-dehydrogenase subunit 3 family protein [Lutimonas sp.]|uniref:gluconate 2-dehydrogenase subunit 3 family protein n=1 Tax=Lutimonas sp. TaxID=1872403 RepID=UPI003D9B2DF5